MSLVSLSIAERLDAALKFYDQENPGGCPSLSKICKLAGVNRSNIYTSHPEFLSRLRNRKILPDKKATLVEKVLKNNNIELLASYERRNKALLLLVIELQEEVLRLEQRLIEAKRHAENRRR
ncbi:hypothetical protein [Rhodoferax sp. OV413]|uniref:hypothetical protein n=1 Tax=Rhodoferax sp. OV413 TaxID=1855285 RepID=UPI00115FBD52|nr:hypothetical protein [Rhodoferax sp. OV413]